MGGLVDGLMSGFLRYGGIKEVEEKKEEKEEERNKKKKGHNGGYMVGSAVIKVW